MREHSPLLRQWPLLRLLCARHYGVTVREMAREMGVTERTIRRDLEVFREVGFPIEETTGAHGRKTWRMKSGAEEPATSFTFDEAIALYLGRRFMEPLAGTLFWEASHRAFRKIRASLGKTALDYLERTARVIHPTTVGSSDYSKKAELIDRIMMGIEERKAVFITYQSLQATEPVTYDIYPYGFAHHRGSLYLIGHSPDRNENRHWKVDRIEEAEITKIPFHLPAGFDVQEHLRASFGIYLGRGDVRVEVRFSPTVARYVQESTWHETQKLTVQKDGSLLVRFRLSDTEEIKRWVLSFGEEAEVVEPRSLRQEITEDCDQSEPPA